MEETRSPHWTVEDGGRSSEMGSPTRSSRSCSRAGDDAVDVAEVRQARIAKGVVATFKTVDTCAAEFEAHTPYHYATYEDERRGATQLATEGA